MNGPFIMVERQRTGVVAAKSALSSQAERQKEGESIARQDEHSAKIVHYRAKGKASAVGKMRCDTEKLSNGENNEYFEKEAKQLLDKTANHWNKDETTNLI